jgi:hypothetical protein
MPKGKLSPEGEVIAAHGAAIVAAFQVLIGCLEESDALRLCPAFNVSPSQQGSVAFSAYKSSKSSKQRCLAASIQRHDRDRMPSRPAAGGEGAKIPCLEPPPS